MRKIKEIFKLVSRKLVEISKSRFVFCLCTFAVIFGLLATSVWCSVSFVKNLVKNLNNENQPTEIVLTEEEHLMLCDSIYEYICKINIDHPDIVYAQCLLETGNLKSTSFTYTHNCFGMKYAYRRPTLAVGVYLGHARFNSWKESIADYAIWQSIFARNLTREEYFKYLDNVYSINKSYMKILKRVIETMHKKEKVVADYFSENKSETK